ncbi:MAG: RES family NAD+ phosphorylase [Chlorobi bacterium]|nr:RES family NAD+ phosphorylase [Chlorobiota bacterium]
MELFRITSEKYSKSLTSSGASNRWNKKGEDVIYLSPSRSLATLEMIVHRNFILPEIPYKVMVVLVPDSEGLIKTIKTSELPIEWRRLEAYSQLQDIGSDWFLQMESLVLKVPSAVIPLEDNYIINTKHKDYDQVKLIKVEDYFWDNRLM